MLRPQARDLWAPPRPGAHALHRRPGSDLASGSADGAAGGVAVQGRQGRSRPADVGSAGFREQPGDEDLGCELQGGICCRDVDGGQDDQVPEGFDGCRSLPMGGQPVAERDVIEPGVLRVEAAQSEPRSQHCEALAQIEMGVGEQSRCQVHRRRAPGAAYRSRTPAGGQDGDVEPLLQEHPVS